MPFQQYKREPEEEKSAAVNIARLERCNGTDQLFGSSGSMDSLEIWNRL